MTELTKSFFRTARFAMVLLALAVPCGTSAVAESLMTVEVETESSAESCEECVSVANNAQTRRKHPAARRLSPWTFSCQTAQLHSRLHGRAIFGHRVNHEQLAPLRC